MEVNVNGHRVSSWSDENVLQVDNDDGYAIL